MKKVLLALVVLVAIAAIAFAVRTLGARDETDAVDSKDAAGIVGDDGGQTTDAGLRPEAGTYTYTGSGSESVDALGGSKHVFPKTVPVVVQLDSDSDSCEWTSNVIYVEQHVEQRNFCTDEDGVIDRGFTRTIEFFNQEQTTEYECGEDARRVKSDATEGQIWSWTCTQGTKAKSVYTATHMGEETLTIGGEDVETVHMRISSKQSGETVGGDASDYWYAETGLPVRFSGNLDVKTKSVLGETRFQEKFTYELASLVPETDDA